MMDNFKKDVENQMYKCVKNFKKKICGLHLGKVSPSLIEGICIEYYGSITPIKQLANITVENSCTLKLSIFDHTLTKIVEKAIIQSNLGLNPIVHGNYIRIVMPYVTEEKRKKIFIFIKQQAENNRVAIRNIRRCANETLKKYVQDKIIDKDLERIVHNEIQKLTNFYINKVNIILSNKELEVMKV
ncbi:ribosome recycling factor [Buchnera aphidicola]|uniref:Ribosome-recycling factor n=1 Tax=Buchnera aphidicola (Stegophylla sp.) TaxID=2315800 RepID=A0A4D6YMT7_9GAMM|nr:ribosome recycling factor [Buchnera aphidicola (Stegophylla sp.)]QCI26335.1 ribosome recycling factor [Buchnera aphidicola (Stegophylla sp.)]